MLGYILAALGLCTASFALLEELGFLGLFIGIGIIVVGHLKSKLTVMKLYAYGELVDRIMLIERKVCNSKDPKCKDTKSSSGNSTVVKPVLCDLPITEKNPDGTWDCMFCDYRNPADTKS